MSNRLLAFFDDENRSWMGSTIKEDGHLSPDGRIMDSMLFENMCEGWLEGYLLTGRYGFFSIYESFIRIVVSMASQQAKWLKI